MEFEPVALNNLYNLIGAKKVAKRVGRGIGSGKGKTSGRGVKGQKARAGVAIKGFEGGQMPIIARLPKRGFNPLKRKSFVALNTDLVNYLIESNLAKEGDTINKEFLVKIGVIKSVSKLVKLLGSDAISKKLNFELDGYSESAKKQVEASGGTLK